MPLKLDKDVLSNLGHFERSLRVGVFYWARTSVDANRIDPTVRSADTILNRMVPTQKKHSARQVLYILRSDFAKKFFYSDGRLSFFNETALGG